MIDIYVGFKFVDNLWPGQAVGEVVQELSDGRFEVRWSDLSLDHTFETQQSINCMIEGRL